MHKYPAIYQLLCCLHIQLCKWKCMFCVLMICAQHIMCTCLRLCVINAHHTTLINSSGNVSDDGGDEDDDGS